MANLFVSGGRLRSGWRVGTYWVLSRIIIFAFSILVGIGLVAILFLQGLTPEQMAARIGPLAEELNSSIPFLFGTEIVQFLLFVGLVVLWRRLVDRRSVRSLGVDHPRQGLLQFVMGAGLVAAVWAVILAASLATSAYAVAGLTADLPRSLAWLVVGLAFNLLVGFSEELDSRGYLLQNLKEGIGFWAAVIVSSLLFGAQHLLNPGANTGALVGTMLFGVIAALAWRATGSLWMPIGMHSAWNFIQGPVLGFLVSGVNMGGFLDLRRLGPDWLTGGTFGPEGGVLTWAPLVILAGLIYWWGRNKQAANQA